MLLDSTFLHDLLRDDPDARDRLHEHIAGSAACTDDPRVLARNVDEFDRVERIVVETY